mgnify:CR=1 FL=1
MVLTNFVNKNDINDYINNLEKYYSVPHKVRHHACEYCKYAMRNELIDDILTETEHNDFA